ncbi:MAG TPA: hypothetical protein VNM24_00850 [Burkholderiales bacterium]|jgi:hypothetical protein|nr:hypothetical protein [Burkholderiales bacterium]
MMGTLQRSAIAACLAIASGTSLAQDADITMQVIEDELPEAVTKQIVLPPEADPQAVIDSEFGLSTANEARQRREQGLSTAREAMERNANERRDALERARSLSEHRSQTGGIPPFVTPNP